MSQIPEIRRALRATLPDDLDAQVLTGPQEAGQAFGGQLPPPRLIVRVYVGDPADEARQDFLDDLLDPTSEQSVATALLTDRTLGGLVKKLHVTGASGWRVFGQGDQAQLGAEWAVQIYLRS